MSAPLVQSSYLTREEQGATLRAMAFAGEPDVPPAGRAAACALIGTAFLVMADRMTRAELGIYDPTLADAAVLANHAVGGLCPR